MNPIPNEPTIPRRCCFSKMPVKRTRYEEYFGGCVYRIRTRVCRYCGRKIETKELT